MSTAKALKAVLFGIAFGFLLQKGGVAEFHILIGALLLEDFTVMKIMLSAVVVGMVGITILRHLGWAELSIEKLQPARNIVGGLIFGAGFAFSAYCPGTGAAALGQLNGDSLFMVLGMLVGSYCFALLSGRIQKWIPITEQKPVRLAGSRGRSEVIPVLVVATSLCTAIALLPG